MRNFLLFAIIIGAVSYRMTFASPVLFYPQIFVFGIGERNFDSLEDIAEHKADSLEKIAEHAEDSAEMVHDKADRVQDSIQEVAVGPEGRDLRFSFVVTFAHDDDNWLFLPAFAIVKRNLFLEYGLHEVAFNQSNPDGNPYFLTISPSIGFVPRLTRPLRLSGGAGSSIQIIFRDHDSFTITPFLYFSGTVFYQKRISSTITLHGRHASTGGFLYISKNHYEIKNGYSWLDVSASIDFYF